MKRWTKPTIYSDHISDSIANGFAGEGSTLAINYLKSLYDSFSGSDAELPVLDEKKKIEVTIGALEANVITDDTAKLQVIANLRTQITASSLSDADKRSFFEKIKKIEEAIPR